MVNGNQGYPHALITTNAHKNNLHAMAKVRLNASIMLEALNAFVKKGMHLLTEQLAQILTNAQLQQN